MKLKLVTGIIGIIISIAVIAYIISNQQTQATVEKAISKARAEDAAFEVIDLCYNYALYYGTASDLQGCDSDMRFLAEQCQNDSSYSFCSDTTFRRYFIERQRLH